ALPCPIRARILSPISTEDDPLAPIGSDRAARPEALDHRDPALGFGVSGRARFRHRGGLQGLGGYRSALLRRVGPPGFETVGQPVERGAALGRQLYALLANAADQDDFRRTDKANALPITRRQRRIQRNLPHGPVQDPLKRISAERPIDAEALQSPQRRPLSARREETTACRAGWMRRTHLSMPGDTGAHDP